MHRRFARQARGHVAFRERDRPQSKNRPRSQFPIASDRRDGALSQHAVTQPTICREFRFAARRQNTGLGIWTEDMFISAIRIGRHMGVSRPINPPMPWPMYRNATDDDLKAVFAYLRTIKPVTNHVPDYEPPPATTTEAR